MIRISWHMIEPKFPRKVIQETPWSVLFSRVASPWPGGRRDPSHAHCPAPPPSQIRTVVHLGNTGWRNPRQLLRSTLVVSQRSNGSAAAAGMLLSLPQPKYCCFLLLLWWRGCGQEASGVRGWPPHTHPGHLTSGASTLTRPSHLLALCFISSPSPHLPLFFTMINHLVESSILHTTKYLHFAVPERRE